MKTKVLLLALLSGFVFSVAAQEYQPQVGFSNELVIRLISRRIKLATIVYFNCGWSQRIVRRPNGEADFKNRLTSLHKYLLVSG